MVSNAHFAPLRSRMVLIATVVPCRNIRAAAKRESALPTPFSMPLTSRCGVVNVLPSLQRAGRFVECRHVGEGAADVG